MKLIIILSIMFGFSFSVNSQNLSYKKGSFIYKSELYKISEIKNLKHWSENDLNMINKIESLENSEKIWKGWTIAGGIGTAVGVGGMLFFSSSIFDDSYALIPITGIVGSYMFTIVGATTGIISGTGWIITTKKRNKKIDSFIDSYNSNLSSDLKSYKLSLNITKTGLGMHIYF